MTTIAVHSAMVLPLIRLNVTSSIVFSGEIVTTIEDPTLTTTIEQEEFITTIDECDVIETTLEQDELVVEIEEDTV